ncbi:hypothetical protein N7539_003381 [Penicillium diatomitis]|uniref:RRM domain-containing protein n=1 Tax=Penicillium diatomitis TaxID=2819901 RepID=A0A9W9XC90_9EURO|nr:uncharacterized protein N7539_003381 [Penicillium diatomitis]KAJ5488491.1 hypothetical protein N7539_003381 [Penicillium diatomitis]
MRAQNNEMFNSPGANRGTNPMAPPFPWAAPQAPSGSTPTQGPGLPAAGPSAAQASASPAGVPQTPGNFGYGPNHFYQPIPIGNNPGAVFNGRRPAPGHATAFTDPFYQAPTSTGPVPQYLPHNHLSGVNHASVAPPNRPLSGCPCPHLPACPYHRGGWGNVNPQGPNGPPPRGASGPANGSTAWNSHNWDLANNGYNNTPNRMGSSGNDTGFQNRLTQSASLTPGPVQLMLTPNGYTPRNLEVLTSEAPAIPRAVPTVWHTQTEPTLPKCLENREGIKNVYIRGFHPDTTDQMIYDYAKRFGVIERCKAIVDLETGTCKGFGFVEFETQIACENAIRAFHYLGYQASFAQRSRNARLKDLEDKSSTNIYCTNIPVDWTEADLRRHFAPYRVVSEKISRDELTGVSKEVGFARFESREIAEQVLEEFHNVTVPSDDVRLLLRFADTKAQKMLKQSSLQRRVARTGQYNVAVRLGQLPWTPSPETRATTRHDTRVSPETEKSADITPESQESVIIYTGDSAPGHWSPATSDSSRVIYATPRKLPPSFHRLTQSDVPQEASMLFSPPSVHRRSATETTVSSKTVRVGSPSL